MKRPKVKLGRVEYYLPGWDKSRVDAQRLFWKAVSEEVPEVPQGLRDEVLPAFREFKDKIFGELPSLTPVRGLGKASPIRTSFSLFKLLCTSPRFRPLTRRIVAWARSFNLDSDWIGDFIIVIMIEWEDGYTGSESPPIRIRFGDIPPWTFGPVNYYPTAETKDAFRARTMAQVESSLDQFIARVHGAFEEQGWPISKTVDLRQLKHFTWLVLYQIKGWSFGRIAIEHNRDRKSVEDAVKNLASLIDLPLRPPAKGGRPRGSKDSQPRNRI